MGKIATFHSQMSPRICADRLLKDGDFQTLRRLMAANALGDIKEAELHYDFEGAGVWFPKDQKEYVPGSGMTFGLGKCDS